MNVNISEAHEELMYRLFGSDITEVDPTTLSVSRKKYDKKLKEVQKEYGLKQGHPQFMEWVFTCVGRSPIIVEDEDAEGAGTHERE